MLVPCRCTTDGPSPDVTTWTRRPDGRWTRRPCAPTSSTILRNTSSIATVCRGRPPAFWMVLMRPRSVPRSGSTSSVSEPPGGHWGGGLARVPRLLLLHQGHRAPRRPVEPAHRAPAGRVRTAGLQRAEPFSPGPDLPFCARRATPAAGDSWSGLASRFRRVPPHHGRRRADAGALLPAGLGRDVASRRPRHG